MNAIYADTRYHARKPRAASIGAALLINGAIIAGMIYSAPNIIKVAPKIFEAGQIPLTPPPEPEPLPTEKPRPEVKPVTAPLPTLPDPLVKTNNDVKIEGTTVIPSALPDPIKPVEPGPITKPEPRVEAPPPLIGATRDGRYAEDFQPEYPASELRLQRDGKVSVRVLVGANGRVKAVEQLSATSAAFFDATRRQALSKWRFKPATRGGVAEESWMTLSVTFRIQDQ